MKKLAFVVVVILLIIAGAAGAVVYLNMSKSGQAVSTSRASATPSQMPASGFPGSATMATMPSPLPTVTQISLTITSPANGASVTSSALVVRGITLPKAEVFVNDSNVIADAQGSFIAQVTLDEGDNTIVVTANDANGNYSEKDVTVTYTPSQ